MSKHLSLIENIEFIDGLTRSLTNNETIESINTESLIKISNLQDSLTDKLSLFDIPEYKNVLKNISNCLIDFSSAAGINLAIKAPIIEIADALQIKWNAIARSTFAYQTPEMSELSNLLLTNNITEGIKSFSLCFTKNIIKAPNIAFLKTTDIFDGLYLEEIPRGLYSIINNLHVGTSQHLAQSVDISLNMTEKCFFDENEPNNDASVSEMNVICSAMEVLGEINETSLMNFMNSISREPEFASEHDVGKKINEVVTKWTDLMNFDKDLYYHARPRENEDCPYTYELMQRAPSGLTNAGRFSHVGQSHFYFSDEEKGAIQEIKKHCKNNTTIQVAKFKPISDIRMIDLSQEIKRNNNFLKYIRFTVNPIDFYKMPREYLIPCYVASCCIRNNIQGIKYYGSNEYKNYVSWHDGYFTCVGFV